MELTLSAHAYQALFDNGMDALLLTAPDGQIVMANEASCRMFGYTITELRHLGREAVVDRSDPRLAPALDERRRTGRFRGELTMRRKDGSTFPVELSSAVFCDDEGHEWTSMSIRDISDRKAQESERERLLKELDAKHRWLEAVLDHVPLSVLLFEPHGRLSFNRRAEEAFGLPLSKTGGSEQYRSLIRLPDGTPITREQMVSTRVLEHGETVTGAEFLIERPDGARVPVLGAAGPILDDAKQVIGAIGIFQDVSERMRAEATIRASERLLNGIFELLPVGVWIVDQAGRVVRSNRAGLSIWGGTREIAPTSFSDCRAWRADTGRRVEADESAVARALNHGDTCLGEVLRIQCVDHSYKTIINSAVPLHDDSGLVGAIVVNEDITVLKDTETALRHAVESRDQVLEVVAHDLRHPLQIIMSLVQALRLSPPTSPEDALRDVETQVQRMNRLIHDLVDGAQLDATGLLLRRTRITPDGLIEDVCHAQSSVAAGAAIALIRDLDGETPAIDVDVARIHRVFENLIENAVKFTPRGGRITVGATSQDGSVRFWVSDTGPGVPTSILARMFTRRWQADTAHGGRGLGLSIAKAVIEAHGGRIWAESGGHGTTVSFTIPLSPN